MVVTLFAVEQRGGEQGRGQRGRIRSRADAGAGVHRRRRGGRRRVELDVDGDGGEAQREVMGELQGGVTVRDAEAVVDGGCGRLGALKSQRGVERVVTPGRCGQGRRG